MPENSSKRRFNRMDVLILLILATILCSIIFRFQLLDRFFKNENQDAAIVSFSVSNLQKASSALFTVGNEFTVNHVVLGELESRSITAAKTDYIIADDGSAETALQPVYDQDRIDVTGTLRVIGTRTEKGFYWNGTTLLCANSALSVVVSNTTFSIKITEIAFEKN